jgi:uncharacterized coiled-coil protein SlyX
MTETKPMTSLFANKGDLEKAQKRIKELEAQLATRKASALSAQLATAHATITRLQSENSALRARPLALAPKKTTAPTSATRGWQKPESPTMSKAEFDTMNPTQKMSFSKAGGKITN